MKNPVHTATGMDARFDKELAAVVPEWKSEFSTDSTHAKAPSSTNSQTMNAIPPRLTDLLREFATAMLITHADDKRLRGRPMVILDVESSGRLWFIASTEGSVVHEIQDDTQVHLTFQNEHESYVSLNGRAALIEDRERLARLWNEDFALWFPGGKEDPKIALIAVTPHDLEYWLHRQPPESGAWDAREAYVHGTKPEHS